MRNFNFSLSSLPKKKLLLVVFLFISLLVIPLTVYLVQQQQETRSKAAPNTTLAFVPQDQTASAGGTVEFDIMLSPGTNQVNFVKLVLRYDPTKLEATDKSFTPDPTSILSPAEGQTAVNGEFTVVLNNQSGDPTKVITQPTKLGKVSFDVIGESDIPTQVTFDPLKTNISSVPQGPTDADNFSENVFLSGAPASITIQADDTEPTASPEPSASPEPTASPEPSTSPEPSLSPDPSGTPSANEAPVCQSLIADRETTGAAPLTIAFTANGSDSDGTVSKVTFNYGDGPVEDVTSTGGIGTGTVSVQKSHTYQTAGTYNASAVLTDNSSGLSENTSCSLTINVTAADGNAEVSPTTLPATGPSQTILGFGALGGILFLIGTILFFAL